MEDHVRVIERVFDIIELLAQAQEPMSLTDIVKRSGISKTTVYRLLQTMCSRCYVEKDKDNCYTVGPKLIEAASCHINGLELQTESKPILAELRRRLNLSVHLGILDGHEIVYLEKMDIYPTMRLYTQVGYRSPAYCSSMGKCLLSCLSGSELEKALFACPFERFTPHTVTNFHDFKKLLKGVRERGWAMDDQEYLLEHRCVGAPVFDYRGDAIASVSASGTTAEITDERLPSVIEEVKRAAGRLSQRMGYIEE
ncbi:MAG: IclR family transcriptional regulator [Cloacibacillus sp.]